jgi:hypothetical protein
MAAREEDAMDVPRDAVLLRIFTSVGDKAGLVLDGMMESGLVTLEAAKVLQYGRQRAGLVQRIKDHFKLNSAAV